MSTYERLVNSQNFFSPYLTQEDLSRLGRDYVTVGQYTDIYFPDHNVRFIAINDLVDSDEGENEVAPFKNVMNEMYARDISRKVRSAHRIRGASGEPLSQPPYGYMKSPENKKKWIIDPEAVAVEQVQKLIGKTRRRNPKPENWERNMFCDLLYCADCGRKLWFNIKHDKEDIPFFMCGNYHGNRGTCSSTHYLRADAIEQVVTLELRRLSKCLCDNEEDFATLLANKTNADIFKEKKHIESEMQKCIVRSEQVAELCIKCYEDNVSGKLTDELFMRFSQKYETERLELKEKIVAYRRRLAEANEMQLGKEKFIAAVRKFMQMDRLTAPLLQELIDRIDVYEVTGTGKNRKQQIKIHYKFVGYLELPNLARQHNYREETRKGVAVEYVPNALPA